MKPSYIKPHSKIQYCAQTAEFLKDLGNGKIKVLCDDTEQIWDWKFEGVECEILRNDSFLIEIVKYFVENAIHEWKIETFNGEISWHDIEIDGTNRIWWYKDHSKYFCHQNSKIAQDLIKIIPCKIDEFQYNVEQKRQKELEEWRSKQKDKNLYLNV